MRPTYEKSHSKSNVLDLDFGSRNNLVMTLAEDEKIALPVKNGLRIVELKDIVCFKANGNHTSVYLIEGLVSVLSKRLQAVCRQLPSPLFVRCHELYCVNSNFIEHVNQSDQVVLNRGEEELVISIS